MPPRSISRSSTYSTAGLTGHDMQALSDKVQKAVSDLYYSH
jgi:hypothetical protein